MIHGKGFHLLVIGFNASATFCRSRPIGCHIHKTQEVNPAIVIFARNCNSNFPKVDRTGTSSLAPGTWYLVLGIYCTVEREIRWFGFAIIMVDENGSYRYCTCSKRSRKSLDWSNCRHTAGGTVKKRVLGIYIRIRAILTHLEALVQ